MTFFPKRCSKAYHWHQKKMLLANFEHYAASLKWVKTAVSRTIFNCSLKISNLFVKLGIVEFTDSENWAVNKR